MYNTEVLQPVSSNKILAAGLRFYELMKLAIKPSVYKDMGSKECLPYIQSPMAKGYTVLDIGSHRRSYFLELFKISKLPGRLIAFETTGGSYTYLSKMKRLMNFENISIEELDILKSEQQLCDTNSTAGATVINFQARVNAENDPINRPGRIDRYCQDRFIIPALIKFRLETNNLDVLYSTSQLLQKYKPQILMECVEGSVSRDTLMKTFKFLTELHYSGNFILDTMKVPLANFDFNIYQNEVLGFYCTNFIFE